MKTLIKPQTKLKLVKLNNHNNHFEDQLNTSKTNLDTKFYQKLFLVFFSLSIFLIFPESPKDLDNLCNKYHSPEACNIF